MCSHRRAVPHLSTSRQEGAATTREPGPRGSPLANLGPGLELSSETRSISTQRNSRSHFLSFVLFRAICTRLQIVFCTVILAELQTIRKDFHNQLSVESLPLLIIKRGFPLGNKQTTEPRKPPSYTGHKNMLPFCWDNPAWTRGSPSFKWWVRIRQQ